MSLIWNKRQEEHRKKIQKFVSTNRKYIRTSKERKEDLGASKVKRICIICLRNEIPHQRRFRKWCDDCIQKDPIRKQIWEEHIEYCKEKYGDWEDVSNAKKSR